MIFYFIIPFLACGAVLILFINAIEYASIYFEQPIKFTASSKVGIIAFLTILQSILIKIYNPSFIIIITLWIGFAILSLIAVLIFKSLNP